MIGLPKLGASARRTFRGITVSKTLVPKYSLRFGGHLPRQVEPRVVHRQQHAIDRELLVHAPLNEVNGVQQLRQPLERVVLALNRNEERVRRGQHVDSDQARAKAGNRSGCSHSPDATSASPRTHGAVATRMIDQLDFGAGQFRCCRQKIQMRNWTSWQHRGWTHECVPIRTS